MIYAKDLFEAELRYSALEAEMDDWLLRDVIPGAEDISYDYYDYSFEAYFDGPGKLILSEEQQAALSNCGFKQCWLRCKDGEVYYSLRR